MIKLELLQSLRFATAPAKSAYGGGDRPFGAVMVPRRDKLNIFGVQRRNFAAPPFYILHSHHQQGGVRSAALLMPDAPTGGFFLLTSVP